MEGKGIMGQLNLRGIFAEGSGAGGVQTAKASRKQSSLSGKESAQGCVFGSHWARHGRPEDLRAWQLGSGRWCDRLAAAGGQQRTSPRSSGRLLWDLVGNI